MQVDFLLFEYITANYAAPGLVIAVAYKRTSDSGEVRCQLRPGWFNDVRSADQREYIEAVLADLQSEIRDIRSDAWNAMEESAGTTTYFRLARHGTCDENCINELLAASPVR